MLISTHYLFPVGENEDCVTRLTIHCPVLLSSSMPPSGPLATEAATSEVDDTRERRAAEHEMIATIVEISKELIESVSHATPLADSDRIFAIKIPGSAFVLSYRMSPRNS